MRILLTSPTYPPFNSGLGNAVAQQAVGLAKAGHEVVVATGGAERSGLQDGDGIRVETFRLSGADCWLQPIRGDIEGYVDLLRENSWDLVVLNAWQNWATDLALRHLDDISGRKFVYSHCISTNVFFLHQPLRSLLRYLAWRPYWWRLPRLIKRLDGVLFLAGGGSDSRFDDLELARRCGVPRWEIPNSLSPAAATVLAEPSHTLAERDRLIAVGSYQWQKGFDFVLRAYAASQACNRIPLHLFGQQYTPYCDTLRSLARHLGLDSSFVVFHEDVNGEKLLAEYCRARLILSGSHTECQPLVLLDANAAGTPFVARRTGCISGMPGGLGVSSWQDMTASINMLGEEAEAWQALSEAGRQAARDIYHPDRVTQKLLEALGCNTNT